METSLYLLLGSVVGVLAGLLGVGGGLIIVPMLAAIFIHQGMPDDIIMHMALGTSLASILFTSISSVYSHHQHQAVNWSRAAKLTPAILLGAWFGGLFAGILSSDILKPVFALFELSVAAYMLWGIKASSHNESPSLFNFNISGGVIGFISSIVGIGGGSMTVPWLMWHGSSIHKAIATSAAVGFPIAIGGAISYLYTGWSHTQLPQYSAGFIYLPALVSISLSSVLFAPLGASLAHKLEVKKLKRVFALLLIGLAIYLFSS
ncbi:MAG: hypothetical protein DIZ80_12500 [endosymbiont of Galathealinum brachiosum]|uniref:Probable membrane transporter protein n=1 Tax=endosymbiont of Galathealinum brachiosum TaxID=2200906 RepID=A0A370DE31_9GAMM|nr:MAG: hypothetical protein DIZ80_12500 [endosymbiont of Galathealinum brachiosum]